MMDRLYRLSLAYLFPAFLAFAVLWKGGKSLEATWILTGVAWLLTLATYRLHGRGKGLPMVLWGGLIVFFFWTLASYITSSTANYGLDEVLRDGSFILIFCWVIRESASSIFVPRFLKTLTWTAGVSALIGIGVYTLQPVNRFVGSFFDFRFQTDYWPNAWGDFVLLTWPLALWFLLIDRKAGGFASRTRVWLGTAGIGAFLGCFFLSYSRGSFLAFIGQVALLVLLVGFFVAWPIFASSKRPNIALKFLFPPMKTKGAGFTALVGAGIAVVLALATFSGINTVRSQLFPVQSVVEKATFTAAEGTSSVDERRDFWEQAFALSLEKPALGWGPYAFRFVQPRLQTGVFATSDHPHNVFLKMAMERGWPAALLLAFIVIFCMVWGLVALWTWRGRLRHGSSELFGVTLPMWTRALFVIALLTATAGTLAHSMIDYNLQFVGNGLLLWTELGLMLAFCLPTDRARQEKYRIGTEVMMATFLIVVAIFEGRYLVTSSLGRHEEAAGNTQAALLWYDASAHERFSRDMHLSRTHLLLDAGLPDSALRALDSYFRVNPEDARAWLLQAEALTKKNEWDGALKAYQKAYELGKYNYVDALRGAILSTFETGDLTGLQQKLPEYEKLINEYSDAIMHNIHFIALTPNVESLASTLDLLKEMNPTKAAEYETLKQAFVKHAQEERERLTGRTPGLLW